MKLNAQQRILVVVGVSVMILMGLFPPWTHTFKYKSVDSREPAGYSFILTPPEKKQQSIPFGIELDVTRLSVQWIIVILATGLGVMLISVKKDGSD